MCRRYGFGACAALILVLNGSALAQQYSFRTYGAADGLQNLVILSLAQDGAGYLWAGSEGGLYRYDGTRFRLMAAAEGLPCATEVHALHVAADGALWANTCAQVFRFDGQRFHPIAGLSGMLNGAERMANDAHGHVLVATASGLYEAVLNGAGSFSARPYPLGPELAGMAIRGIARNGSQLWFGCGRRLCVEDGGRVSTFGPAQGLPDDAWDAIGFTPDGSVWIRSPGRLYRKPPGAARLVEEKPDIASTTFWGALTVDPYGSLLVPTDKGLAIRGEGGWRVMDEQRGMNRAMISAVLRDREGSLWVALIGAGVNRWLGYGEWEAWTKAQGLPSDVIWSIRRDRKGALWVGTSLGLARLDERGTVRTWTRKDGLGGTRSIAGRDVRRLHLGGGEAGQRCAHRCGYRRRLVRSAGRPGSLARPAHRGFSSTIWAGCGLRRPAASFATTGRLFRSFPPHRSTRVDGPRGVGLCGRQTGGHVDHQSRRAVEDERWPVAPIPESGRPPER